MTDPTEQLIEEEEGRVGHVYPDSMGFQTIGVGHLVDSRKGGCLPDEIITALLRYDIKIAQQTLWKHSSADKLNSYRIAALTSLIFQLGGPNAEGFHELWARLGFGDFKGAAAAGLDSKWAQQTPKRAQREMEMLASGLWVPKS